MAEGLAVGQRTADLVVDHLTAIRAAHQTTQPDLIPLHQSVGADRDLTAPLQGAVHGSLGQHPYPGLGVLQRRQQSVQIGELDGARCYWSGLPNEVIYHQRRNAFRAPLKQGQLLSIELAGDKLSNSIKGQLLDISATGCRLRFQGDLGSRLQAGQVYERLSVKLPFGTISTAAELRHLSYEDKLDITYVGMRFYRMDGLAQRSIERFVYQVQREARQLD